MFGKEYATHLDTLLQSFGEINQEYKNKVNKDNIFIEKLKILYVSLFGIPEIGFQIRSLYFKKLTSKLIRKNFEKILDAGSGIGFYTLWLGKIFKNAKVIGIDIDKNKIKSSESIVNELAIKNVKFFELDTTKLHNKSSYDFIVNIDVLEHIDNYEKVIKNFFSVLKKSGYLYIHVPQPNQKRIFNYFRTWRHEDHVRVGIAKIELEIALKKLGFKIIKSKETFGFFGKLAWEFNHFMLSRSFFLAGITFPFLYLIALLDTFRTNKNGLGIALLAQKTTYEKS